MDPLDRFNNVVLELSLNWKYIFFFAAGVYFLATILYLAEGHRWGLAIISWIILVVVALAMMFVLREKSSPEKPGDPSQ
jgi:hypothetical protein